MGRLEGEIAGVMGTNSDQRQPELDNAVKTPAEKSSPFRVSRF
jgi:hypothetical protein